MEMRLAKLPSSSDRDDDIPTGGGPNSRLTHHLPSWAIPRKRVNRRLPMKPSSSSGVTNRR
jgi:hypothetical protein